MRKKTKFKNDKLFSLLLVDDVKKGIVNLHNRTFALFSILEYNIIENRKRRMLR